MVKRKYFIALILKGEAFERAENIKHELFERFGLRGALRSPAHITLHRPFEWSEEKEGHLREKLRTFKVDRQFKLNLHGWDTFSKRVIFIAVRPAQTLGELHTALKRFAKRELGLLNEWEDERGFYPHVTVAFRDLKTKNFAPVWEFVQSLNFDEEMTVSGFSLLRLEEKWEELEYFEYT